MYTNDNLKFMVNGVYTDKIFLSRGVKQGNSKSEIINSFPYLF